MKKFLFSLLCFLIFSSVVYAATEDQEMIVQHEHATGAQNIVFLSQPTAGCTMTVAVAGDGGSGDIAFDTPAVTDADGNTYTVVQSSVAGRQVALVAVADNISVVTDPFVVTVRVSSGVSAYTIKVAKSFCGLANPALDKSATATDPGPQASDATVTTAATTQANETVIAVAGVISYLDSNMNILTPTPGYTSIVSEQDASLYQTGNISWKNVTSVGPQSASWSHDDVTNNGVYDGWVAAIVTLKDATPGGGTTARKRAMIIQ